MLSPVIRFMNLRFVGHPFPPKIMTLINLAEDYYKILRRKIKQVGNLINKYAIEIHIGWT